MEGSPSGAPRKVMVVVDPTRESAGALQYALSHVVVEKDQLILVHIENANATTRKIPSITAFLKKPTSASASAATALFSAATPAVATALFSSPPFAPDGSPQTDNVNFLEEMKRICEIAQPKVPVSTTRVQIMESNNKAAAILSQTEVLRVDLLIIGQRKTLSNVLLGGKQAMPTKAAKTMDTAEYLIEHSKCTCVGVLRKGQNAGYLLNTKHRRNFWLLA